MNVSQSKWTKLSRCFESVAKFCLLLFVGVYRSIGTTFLGGSCRFEPSCSEYAVEALHTHPPGKAFGLITRRVCKCRPGGPSGWDPVPRKFERT